MGAVMCDVWKSGDICYNPLETMLDLLYLPFFCFYIVLAPVVTVPRDLYRCARRCHGTCKAAWIKQKLAELEAKKYEILQFGTSSTNEAAPKLEKLCDKCKLRWEEFKIENKMPSCDFKYFLENCKMKWHGLKRSISGKGKKKAEEEEHKNHTQYTEMWLDEDIDKCPGCVQWALKKDHTY